MRILVTNAGSSSLKVTCFDSGDMRAVARGMVERIGHASPVLHFRPEGGPPEKRPVSAADAGQALRVLVECLAKAGPGDTDPLGDIALVGHRVVHGGEDMTRPVLVSPEVKQLIARYAVLAPLHNPPGLACIEAAQELIPHAAHLAVFDTAFHAAMPEHAFIYALPWELYEQDKLRRYGFHGISHGYVFHEAARHLEMEPGGLKAITCHLGNGCSMAAVDGGASLDTSMGFTPLEGLIMGTRCGDLDPATVIYLQQQKGMSPAQVLEFMNHRCGLLAMAGIGSGDLRDIEQEAEAGNPRAILALDAFTYRIKKYLGAYAAALGGLDAVVFTAGIGENSPTVRRLCCAGLEWLGLELDQELNQKAGEGIRDISAPSSRVRLLVIPTNEELAIAQQVVETVRSEDIITARPARG